NCPDYFQPFMMNAATSAGPDNILKSGDAAFILFQQYAPLGFSAQGKFSAPLAFAGYGISSKDRNYDDYASLDVKDKVVLILRYEPHNEKGESRFEKDGFSSVASLGAKAKTAADHGALAVLLVNPPNFHGNDDQLIPIARGGAKSTIPFIQITRKVADDLLKQGGSDKNLQQLQTQIDATGKPASFTLQNITIAGNIDIQHRKVQVKNVLAYLPGTVHPDEFIVIGAHYDHLGHGGPASLAPNSTDIHHGADDNASGAAAVLDVAEKISRSGPRDRSILFICFTGEEEGLLGSDYFVAHPPIELKQIVAMLNMDMVGRLRNQTLYTSGEGTAASFESMLQQDDAGLSLQLKSIGRGGFGPTDHQSFAAKKIPVIFFFTGMHSDYHRPTDTADKINYAGLAEVSEFAERVVDSLATMPRQQYVGKYDSQGLTIAGYGSRGPSVTLGVVPDYGTDESTVGVRITGTSENSPAEKAGLKDGDIIVQIADQKIDNLYDLSDFLAKAKAGEQVSVFVLRDKQRIELHATLAERKQPT
ncbi:MAG TPA: M20/M25/M40 family metallo-hydrolase, partial [Tepidisphaeraceae bacterium]